MKSVYTKYFSVNLNFVLPYSLSCVEEYTPKVFYLSGCERGFALITISVKNYGLEMETVGGGLLARRKEKDRPEKTGEWEYGDQPDRGLQWNGIFGAGRQKWLTTTCGKEIKDWKVEHLFFHLDCFYSHLLDPL